MKPARPSVRGFQTVPHPKKQIDLSVVIPAYRSAPCLPALVDRLIPVLEGLGTSYEVIFVEDSSPDETWAVLRELQQTHPQRINLIRLQNNFGQHNALMCGFRHARGRLIATLDDDLQHQPEELPKLIDELERGQYDLVYGGYKTKRHNTVRKFVTIPVLLFYQKVFRSKIAPTSFRVLRREVVQGILYYDRPFTVIDGLLSLNTRRIGRVFIDHAPRAEGRSTHSFRKLLLLAFNLFTNFSVLPLRFVSLAGAVAGCAGTVIVALGALELAGTGVTAIGLLIVCLGAIVLLGGAQLLALGLLGEYIGRIHINVNRHPQYLVREYLPAAESGHASELVPPTALTSSSGTS